jgi:DNA-binding transcriptional LysR family regulator
MDLESIRIFLRVVERGSFTAAAALLGLPLSRVSRKIRMLEADLGVQLLHRTTRRISVTEAGREYYERCVIAEGLLQEAGQAVRILTTEPEGTLRVLVPYAVGLLELEPSLAEFRSLYPKVRVVLVYDNSPLDLIEHGIDVALRAGPLPDSGYVARSLGWSRAKLVASPRYLDRIGRPVLPRDLSHCDVLFVGRDVPGPALRLANGAGEVVEFAIKPVLISNESVTVLRQAVSGEGIALVSTHIMTDLISSGELEIVLPDWHRTPDVELNAIFARRATLDQKIRVFVEFVQELFAGWQVSR